MPALDWSRYRAVVFDVDGTLYDPRPLRRQMLAALALHCLRRPSELRTLAILRRFRHERELLAEAGHVGVGTAQYERPATGLGITPAVVEAAVARWMDEHPLRYLRRCRYPGIEHLFARLRAAGKTIAVWSDYPAVAKLRVLELEADLVVSALDPAIDRLKPDPQGLRHLLEQLGVEPQECLLIGDRDDRDGEAARRLGVPYLLKAARPAGDGIRFHEYGELVATLS